MIQLLLWPVTIAAWTYSRVRSDSTSPRTSRATGGQLTMAIAATIETMEGCRMATSTIASAKLGTVWKNSVKRIRASSILPPKYPAAAPSGMPTASEASVEIRPTSSDTRAP